MFEILEHLPYTLGQLMRFSTYHMYSLSLNRQVLFYCGTRGLNFGRHLDLHPYSVCASSKGSGETTHLHMLIGAFAACLYM